MCRAGVYSVRFLNLYSGEITEVLSVEEDELRVSCLAISPDEKTFLYGASPLPRSELMLVETFQ